MMKYNIGDIFVKKTSDSAVAVAMEDVGTIVQIETYGQNGNILDIKVQWSDVNRPYSYSEADLDNFMKWYTHYPVKV